MNHPLITQVLWRLDRAGAERMVFELATRLPLHGFRVRVVAAGGGGVMARDFREAGVPLAIGPRVGSSQRRQTLDFLRHELRGHWPAVWHTHLGGDIWGGRVVRELGFHPWVATVHDLQPHPFLKRWLRGHALRKADEVVCISETVKQHVAEVYKRKDRVEVIRLGVELQKKSQCLTVTGEHRLQNFVVVGRLVADKRVELLISALAGIREPWHLDVVGEGPARIQLEQLVERLHLRARVRFVGSVTNVSAYLAHADACLFASRSEGQGMAVLEAVAANVPVISTDLPALRELFDGTSMTFVPLEADVRGWMQVIQRYMYEPQAAHAQAQLACKIVEERCSIDRMVEEYAELYHRLIHQHRAP